jgi:hypothetical protein
MRGEVRGFSNLSDGVCLYKKPAVLVIIRPESIRDLYVSSAHFKAASNIKMPIVAIIACQIPKKMNIE